MVNHERQLHTSLDRAKISRQTEGQTEGNILYQMITKTKQLCSDLTCQLKIKAIFHISGPKNLFYVKSKIF